MGNKDLLGNWFSDTGIVVTPSGDYGYYDENLNLVSTRNKGEYYFNENGCRTVTYLLYYKGFYECLDAVRETLGIANEV